MTGGKIIQANVNKTKVQVVKGDITKEEVDAVVNAANNSLLGGGGVDGAIHRAGGAAILAECRNLNGCKTGDAKITTAGDMPAKYVIHTVGPVYGIAGDAAPGLLASCYRRVLEVAAQNGLKSIAFPAISTGVYGYPMESAAKIAIKTIADYATTQDNIALVRFVQFDEDAFNIYKKIFAQVIVTD